MTFSQSLRIVNHEMGPGTIVALHNPLIACHECDLLHRIQQLRVGERANCTRCGALLYHKKRDSFEIPIALTLGSLVLFLAANVFPFMTFKLHGRVQESILVTGVKEFYAQGLWELATVVFAVSILFPFLKILGMLYVLVPLHFKRRFWKVETFFRTVEILHPWAMTDVYMLGVLVALVKLGDFGGIVPGIAFYSFSTMIIIMAAATAAIDPHAVWEKIEAAR